MRILAVDTSSRQGSLALTRDGEVQGEVRLEAALQRSDGLFQSIDFLLRQLAWTVADIDVFAAARGPGSFTGLRVGLAAMEGLAFAAGKTAVGVSTLTALAWEARTPQAWIAPMLDARRGEIYGAVFSWNGETWVEELAPRAARPEVWLAELPDRPIAFCGEAAERADSLIRLKPTWKIVPAGPFLAGTIARLAEAGRGESLDPLYIRPPAEIPSERERAG